MSQEFNADNAMDALESGIAQAQEILNDPEKLNEVMQQVQDKVQNLPDTFQTAAANVPLMADMVKSYITKEYTDVSPKVVASLVAAFLYLLKARDLIPDSIPLLGLADDLAVATAAMTLCEPELKAYAAWRENNASYEA